MLDTEIQSIKPGNKIDATIINKIFYTLEKEVNKALVNQMKISNLLENTNKVISKLNETISSYTTIYSDNLNITSFDINKTSQLYLPITSKFSLIPVYENKVNPNVIIKIDNNTESYGALSYNMIDGNDSSYFIDETATTLQIIVPPSISNKINYVKIKPTIPLSFDIIDIKYVDTSGTSKSIINGKVYTSIEQFIFFNPVQTNGSIIITTNNGFNFSEIDFGFADFDKEKVFEISSGVTGKKFDILGDNTTKEYIDLLDNEDKPVSFKNNSITKTVTKIKLKEYNFCTPVILGIKGDQ